MPWPSSCSRRRSRASTELIDGATADSPLDHFEQAARLAVRLVMQSLWRRRSASSWAGTATSGCAGAGRLSHTSRPGGSLPTRAMTRPRSSSDSCRADPSGAGRRVVDAALVEPVQPAVDHDRMAAELGRALASELGGSTVPTAGDDAGALEPAGRGMPGVGELAQGAFPAGSAGGQAYSDGVTIRSLRARAGTYFTRGSSNYNGI
jgi:hypothetical protein